MTNSEPLLLTIDHAAKRLSISSRTMWRLVEAGELVPVRIGRSVRLRSSDLQDYVDRRMSQSNIGPGVAVHGESTCHDARPRTGQERGSTNGRARRTGGRSTPTDKGARLAEVLGFPSPTTPKD
ncbi:helix-turn-helix domain-containing protein [Imhoffiella purpurea]|uniref:helix-turn-helix domain-containing protein n=1 Tax=Imhoffiella purpurea TaxID=1249627 RepID=UPI0009DEBCA3